MHDICDCARLDDAVASLIYVVERVGTRRNSTVRQAIHAATPRRAVITPDPQPTRTAAQIPSGPPARLSEPRLNLYNYHYKKYKAFRNDDGRWTRAFTTTPGTTTQPRPQGSEALAMRQSSGRRQTCGANHHGGGSLRHALGLDGVGAPRPAPGLSLTPVRV